MDQISPALIFLAVIVFGGWYLAWIISSINEIKKYGKETSKYLSQINDLLIIMAKKQFDIIAGQENKKAEELNNNSPKK